MASLSSSGLAPMSAAMAGSEVAMTVESIFSMNSATATISGTRRSRVIGCGFRRGIRQFIDVGHEDYQRAAASKLCSAHAATKIHTRTLADKPDAFADAFTRLPCHEPGVRKKADRS